MISERAENVGLCCAMSTYRDEACQSHACTAAGVKSNSNPYYTIPFHLISSHLCEFIHRSRSKSMSMDCVADESSCMNKAVALRLRVGALFAIIVAGAVGVSLPLWGLLLGNGGTRWCAWLSPKRDTFLVVKAVAAGVILATGFVHVLPDATENLTHPCLTGAWQNFPFAGFVAMMAALASLVVDFIATSYYQRLHNLTSRPPPPPPHHHHHHEEDETPHAHNNNHAHGHHHIVPFHDGSVVGIGSLRHKVISQVLEVGIVAHSVIIGIMLGASQVPCTIRPLLGALTFHQFFEGIGLGGCIAAAEFRKASVITMAVAFSLTTPLGIAIGLGISSTYNEKSEKSLIVQGLLDAASSGILIYMALVDLIAADFLSKRMRSNLILQAWSCFALFLGAGGMSLLAIWA